MPGAKALSRPKAMPSPITVPNAEAVSRPKAMSRPKTPISKAMPVLSGATQKEI